MGKKAKEHRAKVEKRNRKLAQERYAMQNAIKKMMEKMEKESEDVNVTLGDNQIPFEIVEGEIPKKEEDTNFNLPFNEPEFDSAGFSIEDREIDIEVDGVFVESNIEKEQEEE
jgi:hypothetical protein